MNNIVWGSPENEAFFRGIAKDRHVDVSAIHFIVAEDPAGGPSVRIYPKDRLPKNFFSNYSNFHIYLHGGTVAQYAPWLAA